MSHRNNGNRIEQAFVQQAGRNVALPASAAIQMSAEQQAAAEAHARRMFAMELAKSCAVAMSASAQPPNLIGKRAFAIADSFMEEFEARNKPVESPPTIATE